MALFFRNLTILVALVSAGLGKANNIKRWQDADFNGLKSHCKNARDRKSLDEFMNKLSSCKEALRAAAKCVHDNAMGHDANFPRIAAEKFCEKTIGKTKLEKLGKQFVRDFVILCGEDQDPDDDVWGNLCRMRYFYDSLP